MGMGSGPRPVVKNLGGRNHVLPDGEMGADHGEDFGRYPSGNVE
jgi:hypothetical protein